MSVTVPPPTPVPPPGYWPMPPPGTLPGCGPPSNSLMECYWSVQSATAFISTIMIDAINNNPAVAQAIIDAIEKSGSNLPLIGVTNGADAQPGQVGELIYLPFNMPFTAASQVQNVTFGTLPPGDWDYWCYGTATTAMTGVYFYMPANPAGFNDPLWTSAGEVTGATQATIISGIGRALISVPALIAFQVGTNFAAAGPGAGTLELSFRARRRR